jgi:hypothetical protein
MYKAINRGLMMGDIKLLDKSGDKSRAWGAAK